MEGDPPRRLHEEQSGGLFRQFLENPPWQLPLGGRYRGVEAPSMRITVLLLLAMSFPGVPAAAAEKPLLERLSSGDETVREQAEDEWETLDEEARFRLALANLGSENGEIAWFCADRLDPWRLNVGELRLRAAILSRHPDRYLLPGGEGTGDILAGLGASELASLWRHFSKLTVHDRKTYFDNSQGMSPADEFEQTHRQMGPDHLPILAELLEAEDPVVFEELFWTLSLGSEFTDRHRETVARACLYAMARLRAMENDDRLPRLADFSADSPEPGLPDAFVALARQTWMGEPKLPQLRDGLDRRCADGPWLLRWARGLPSTKKDVPFLIRTARSKVWIGVRAWAVHALAGIDDPIARKFVADSAAGEGDLAPFAAAEFARRGKPGRFLEILHRPEPGSHCRMLALEVAPDALWRLWLADPPERSWGWDPSGLAEIEADFGLRIRPETFLPLIEEALRADLPLSHLVGLLESHAELFTREMLEDLVGRFLREPLPGVGDSIRLDVDLDFPAHLEVRAPDLLVKLLDRLAKSPSEDTAVGALCLLARLGDPRRLEPTLARIEDVLSWDFDRGAAGPGALRDDRVKTALEAVARSEDRETACRALISLCVLHGLDPRFARFSMPWEAASVPGDAWTRFRDAALGGDPTRAVLALLEAGGLHEDAIPYLGLSRDPRALATLRWIRERRTKQYWPATGGLALAGDGPARAELIRWVRDARTVMLDDMFELLVVAMEVDPSIIDLQIERLESNCCLGFYAIEALGRRFPTLDTHYEMRGFPQTKRRIRDWYERHRGKFRWSRIARGWVPAE